MRESKFSATQIVAILNDAENGAPVRTCCGSTSLLRNLRPESKGERSHTRITRHEGEHMASSGRTGHQPNHSWPIEASHSVCADVCTAGVADWLPIQ
jgi:hypothetical protein